MREFEPTKEDPRVLLENELAQRLRRNPRYSMRSFAKSLGVSHSLLSLLLSGKRQVSRKMSRKIDQAFGLATIARSGAARSEGETSRFHQLSLDQFALLSEWYHYAVLSLLEIPGTRLDSRWIAKRLRIGASETRLAISRLRRLKLIALANGRWRQCVRPLKVENSISTAATRKYHQQILQKAAESLENDSFDRRDFSSMTLAMSSKSVPYARKRIQEFRRKLARELEKMGTPDEVYHLAVQIYPVSHQETEIPNE